MPLSEEEQRVLDQLEQQLKADDPTLAHSMRGDSAPSEGVLRKLVIAISGVVVGLILLVIGVSTPNPLIGITGFLVMFGAVVYATLSPSSAS